MNNIKATLIFTLLLVTITIKAQLVTTNTLTPQQLVQQVLLGAGVTASNITFTGDVNQHSKFNATVSTNIGILSGILLSTGNSLTSSLSGPQGPNNAMGTTTGYGNNGDADLDILSGLITEDAAILEFDFVPTGDSVKFKYCFGSEEYPEFVGGGVNDAFGFFLSGPNPSGGNYASKNIALLPNTTTPVAIDNVNATTNAAFYRSNTSNLINCEFDGFTVVLTALEKVICGQSYHIKIAIADGGDDQYDSGVFLEGGSFSSIPPLSFAATNANSAVTDTILYENCNTYCAKIIRNGSVLLADSFNLTVNGSAINGSDYATLTGTVVSNIVWPTKVVFQANQDTFKICGISILEDNLVEGLDSIVFNLSSFNTSTTSCLSSNTIKFNVFLGDQKSLTLATSNQTVCTGQTATLNATPALGLPPYTYTWLPSGSTNTIITGVINSPQNYTVTVMDGCNEVETQTITVFAANVPTLTVNSETICAGATVTLVANGAPNYSWSNNLTLNNDSNIFIPVTTANYTVIGSIGSCTNFAVSTVSVIGSAVNITGINQLCNGASATLTAIGGNNNFVWDNLTTNNTIIITPSVTTTYSVISSLGICTYTAQKTVTVNITPTVSVNNATLCAGQNATLIAQSNATLFTWTGGGSTTNTNVVIPTTTSNYTVTAINSICTNSAVATVTVYNVSAIISGTNQLCNGSSASLTVNGGNSYLWSTNETTTTINVTPTITTTYSVTSTVQTCTSSAVHTVSVNPKPSITITSAPICINQTATLTASGANSYVWNTGVNSNVITATPTVNTTFSVIGATAFNCTNTASYTQSVITTAPKIDALFEQMICLDTIKTIPVKITGGTAPYTIAWQIPVNGFVPFDTINNYYYIKAATEGVTNYTIDVIDFCNLKDTTNFNITVNNCTIIVPNVVTVNGDGVNDVFKINGLQFFSNTTLNVFNRWGKQVYNSTNYQNDWKPELNNGTYFYVVVLTDGRKFNGFIEIIN